jgi:pyruvate/2-oxoglutarate dehydrogenase complex dihydrolipoamide dehydrogenase (E3) component
MATPEPFDAILIGAGQAANPLSRSLAHAGWKVALVERAEIGGTCVNWGCTPTKTMVASARVAYLAGRASDYGVHVNGVAVRLHEVHRRKQLLVEKFRAGSERRLQETDGLTLLRGEASFTGPSAVAVKVHEGDTRHLTAPKIFINTGCRPKRPDVDGLASVPALDSTTVMELVTLPEHLVVLGGGYVGLEFAQMFRRFGSRVTLVQSGDQLLSHEDADVAAAVGDILREDGIEVLLNARAVRAAAAAGAVYLKVRTPAGEQTLAGTHLLLAAGRVPNTESLNLAASGINTDERGYVPVNERLETNVPGVYALGDVNGGPAFTHVAHHDNQIVRVNLLENRARSTRDRLVPYTVFIDPELGRVGLTERQARQSGLAIKVAKMPMAHAARAVEVGESRGFMKAVVDARTDQILGCAVLGLEAGEVMAMLQIAMMGGLPYQRLRDDMFAHPTLAESLNNLFTHFA